MSIQVGDRLVLAGRTLKGKNRIHESGTDWIVLRVGQPLARPNMWPNDRAFIESVQEIRADGEKDCRWLALPPEQDEHMEIVSSTTLKARLNVKWWINDHK